MGYINRTPKGPCRQTGARFSWQLTRLFALLHTPNSKKPQLSLRFCALFDAWQFMYDSVIPPSGRCKQRAKSEAFSPALLLEQATALLLHSTLSKLMPGSSLLSHGETPHYHRRYGVSLLSSAWGQVGPPRYCRQANSFYSNRFPHHSG